MVGEQRRRGQPSALLLNWQLSQPARFLQQPLVANTGQQDGFGEKKPKKPTALLIKSMESLRD